MRLLCVVAFALCFGNAFSGVAQAQTTTTVTVVALPPNFEGQNANFSLILNNPATQRLTVRVATIPGSGANAALELPQGPFEADYRGFLLDFTFEIGSSRVDVPVTTIQDQSYEFDETFSIQVFGPRFNGQTANNVVIANGGIASNTILNDDDPPAVTLRTPPAQIEGDSNNNSILSYNFTVDIGTIAGRPLNLLFSTTDGTATSQGSTPGTVDFSRRTDAPIQVPAGTRQITYSVDVFGDDVYEGDEAFQLTVRYAPDAATTGTATSTVTGIITDNDLPTYRIDDTQANNVTEGNPALFTISLVDRNGLPVSALSRIDFTYTLQSVTATLNEDFTNPQGGSFSILPGQRDFQLTVPTIDDNVLEQVETFRLIINSATGTIAPLNNVGNASIIDNDSSPIITIQNAQVNEGTGGTNSITFTVTLTSSSGQPVAVDYQTVPAIDGAANTRATEGADYTSIPTTRLNFAANQTTKTFTVPIVTDNINELDETFRVRLSNPANASFNNNAAEIFAIGTIIDDDPAGTVSVGADAIDVAENVVGRIVNIPVNFVPNGTPARPVTVDFTTVAGTAAQAGQRDYFGKSGRLTFGPGVTAQNIPIEIIDDTIREDSETFTVRLTAVNGATLITPSETVVTITDNDPLPSISVTPLNARFLENEGTKNFVVTLTGQSQAPVTVNYAFVDGTAIQGTDYTGVDGAITFTLGGPRSVFVSVGLTNDNIAEANETFQLVLSKDPNDNTFTLPTATATATATIVDNDAAPDLTISNAQIPEGSTGDINTGAVLNFTVTLSRASSRDVTFTYSTLNLRQTNCTPARGCDVASDDDYASVRNVPVTIPAGQTTATISVNVAPDALNEFNEQFAVVARALVNAVPSVTRTPSTVPGADDILTFGTVAYGTIVNDDAGGAITLTRPTADIAEGYDRDLTNRVVGDVANFVVTLPAPAGRVVTVNYVISGAVSAGDLEDLTTGPGPQGTNANGNAIGQVSFFPGTTTRTIALRALADNLVEGNESLRVTISINDVNGNNNFTTPANTSTAQINVLDRSPRVNSFTPTIGFPAYGTVNGTQVTINGNQLRTNGNPRVDAVLFNGVAVGRGGIQYNSDNSITVTVPSGAKSGQLTLRLTNGFTLTNSGLTSNAQALTPLGNFIVQPVIDSFTPTTGVVGSTSVTITGRNFRDGNNPVSAVSFNGTNVNVTPTSDTQIVAVVPAGATTGPLRIVTTNNGTGPASQGIFTVTSATAGGLALGANPDLTPILENSGINISQPARNFDGGDNSTFHQPYLVFLNPARATGSGNTINPQAPLKLRFTVTDSTNGTGSSAPQIAVRADLANAGRPTALVSSTNGVATVTVPAGYNTANPFEVFITYAGRDNLPPVVGGDSATVTVRAAIFDSQDTMLYPNTVAGRELFVTVGRREVVTNANQTAIVFAAGTTSSFSLPFSSAGTNSIAINDVFTTPYNATSYMIYRFDAANQTNNRTNGVDFKLLPPGSRLERGIGYRLVVGNTSVQLRTRGSGLQVAPASSFSYNLTRNVPFAANANSQGNATNGYNFIGFPFDPTQFAGTSGVNFNQATVTFNGTTIPLSNAAAAGLINPQLFTTDDSGALVAVTGDPIIRPFQAYYVQIFRDNLTLNLNNTAG